MGAEITEATLPAELGLNDVAVSFTKGCYPGQELVERMDSRGASAPRSLQRIPAAGHRVGDALVVDGVEIGRVTSVAGDWALALVKRGALAANAQASASD
jgi:folate-binding protein YgfZ